MKDRCGNIVDEEKFFGPLYPYISNDDVTDIDFSGNELWITDCNNTRTRLNKVVLDNEFIEQFTKRVSNMVSQPFHKMSPILEAETETLRITIVHEDVCQGHRCICIRKSLPRVRLTDENVISSGYMKSEVFELLKGCVKAGMNIVFAGNPGVGKTECARFFSNFITPEEKVITIEDTPEWHYSKMNPGKDCVEMTIGKNMDYTRAIKTCMRLNPKWMILSEARSVEVLSLIEGFSTGVHGMTTIHTDDVRNIPDRILNMAAQKRDENKLLNDIYTFVDVGVLIRRKEIRGEDGRIRIKRFVDQVCFYTRENGTNETHLVVEDGQLNAKAIPQSVRDKLKKCNVEVMEDTEWSKVESLLERNRRRLEEEAELQRKQEVSEYLIDMAKRFTEDSEEGGTYIGKDKCVRRA